MSRKHYEMGCRATGHKLSWFITLILGCDQVADD